MTTQHAHRLWPILLGLVGGAGLCMGSLACAQEAELGRLLFSPQQRLAIERARVEHAEADDAPGARTPAKPGVISLDGLVTRSQGAPSIWVNGRLVEPGNERATGLLSVEGRTVRVHSGTRLKVGQTIDSSAPSKVLDLVEPGSLSQGGVPTKRKDDPAPGLRLKPSTSNGTSQGSPP